MSLEFLTQAIKNRSKISFEYNKEGKVTGARLGNPHAIFIMHKKNGEECTKVHIVQTGGVSDSQKDIPSFRLFDLAEISNVHLINPVQHFAIDPAYNPEWDGYKFVIAKV